MVLGCLGGAFKTAIEVRSFLYSRSLLLCIGVDYISVCTRAKHGHRSLVTGGSDPTDLLGGSARTKVGSLPPILVFCPRAELSPSFYASGYFSRPCRSTAPKTGWKGRPKVDRRLCVTFVTALRATRDETLGSKRAVWPSTSSVQKDTSCLGARSRNCARTMSEETRP